MLHGPPTMNIHLAPVSGNRKTGPIPVSTSPSSTCPSACPLLGQGCYGEAGPIVLHRNNVNSGNRGMTWEMFLNSISELLPGTLWRHNQVGDLPHVNDRIDREKAEALTAANKGRKGFTFSHHDVLGSRHNREVIRSMNEGGFVVNLSADDLSDADAKAALDIGPVVTLLPKEPPWPKETPGGRRIMVCLNITHHLTCMQCRLCQASPRKSIVGFPVHGNRWKKAESVYFRIQNT